MFSLKRPVARTPQCDLRELQELARQFARTLTPGWNVLQVNGRNANLHSLPHRLLSSVSHGGYLHDYFLEEDGTVWECRYHEHLFSSSVDRDWTRCELDGPHTDMIVSHLKNTIGDLRVRL